MKLKIVFCGVLLLSACHTLPSFTSGPSAPGEKPASGLHCSALPGYVASTDTDELVLYQCAVQQMSAQDLSKALSDLAQQPKSAKITLQKAILLATLRGNGDLARAQTLLDLLMKATDSDAGHLKPLAYLLNANYAEWRRMDDNAEKFNQQMRDSQKRVEQLTEKLEALKNIERTLPTRPGATAPAASAPNGQ